MYAQVKAKLKGQATQCGCHMLAQCWRKTKMQQKQHIRVEIALKMLRIVRKTNIIDAIFIDFLFLINRQ
jgi:hypothetical protein